MMARMAEPLRRRQSERPTTRMTKMDSRRLSLESTNHPAKRRKRRRLMLAPPSISLS
jgi:hypothetical protein